MNTPSTAGRLVLLSLAFGASLPVAAQSLSDILGNGAAFGYAYSSKAGLDRGGRIGDVAIEHLDFAANIELPSPPGLKLLANAFWSHDRLKLAGDVPLPARLESIGIGLGLGRPLAPRWVMLAVVRPGFASDSSNFSSASFNLAALVIEEHQINNTTAADFGLIGQIRSKYPLLPLLGIHWSLGPDWTLALGFPRTEVSRKLTEQLTFKAGVRFQGGGYRVTSARAPGLGDTYLDYHEFRLGGGFDYRATENFTVELDGGAVVDRRFDYYDRDYRLTGASAAYFRLRAKVRF